jgi:hypothetical protein
MIEPRYSADAGIEAGEVSLRAGIWPFRHVWNGTMISAGGHDQVCCAACVRMVLDAAFALHMHCRIFSP